MDKQKFLISKHYNNVSNDYDQGYNTSLYKGEDQLIMNLISPFIGESVLDLGCGTGLFLEYHDNLKKYLGIDISEDMLKHARKKFPTADFQLGDMHSINQKDNSFDTIVCLYGTFSYSNKPKKLISEIKRLLKPNGYAIIMPYSLRVKNKCLLGYCAKSYNPELEINYYNKNVNKNFELNDFVLKKVYGINYLGYPLSLITNPIRSVFKFLPDVGYGYLSGELLVLDKINSLLNNRIVNMARHIMIIAQLKDS